jgi:hypothetical protein
MLEILFKKTAEPGHVAIQNFDAMHFMHSLEAGLYVGEVLPEKKGHVRVEAFAIRHGRVGMGPTVPLPRRVRKPAHRETVADIPGDAGNWPTP